MGAFGSGKANALLNLISRLQDIDKIYLCAKDSYEPKYQLLIKKCKNDHIKHCNDPKAFIIYWNTMDDVYNNINNHNPKRNRKILIVFDDMIANMNSNTKFHSIDNDCLLGVENWIHLLYSLHNPNFLLQKTSD